MARPAPSLLARRRRAGADRPTRAGTGIWQKTCRLEEGGLSPVRVVALIGSRTEESVLRPSMGSSANIPRRLPGYQGQAAFGMLTEMKRPHATLLIPGLFVLLGVLTPPQRR